MPAISRRELFKNTAMGAAVAGILRANPLAMPIGCQTYPVRNLIAKDFPGTIKVLAEAGFQTIELCSPVGYADSGFAGLAKYKGAEMRRILGDVGIKCESSHFDIGELRKDLAGRIAWANDLGLTQMMVPSLDGPRPRNTTRWAYSRPRPASGRAFTMKGSSLRWWAASGPMTS